MPDANDWEFRVNRLAVQRAQGHTRTYGDYAVYRAGVAVPDLSGHVCECMGPGDNLHAGNGQRIQAGRYPLSTQFGHYRTIGYVDDTEPAGTPPMPALLLRGTGNRTGILIHPGHPPTLYISSIGCLNPTAALADDQSMDFWDSRARTIALIDDLRNFAPAAFAGQADTPIPNAFVTITGEPA